MFEFPIKQGFAFPIKEALKFPIKLGFDFFVLVYIEGCVMVWDAKNNEIAINPCFHTDSAYQTWRSGATEETLTPCYTWTWKGTENNVNTYTHEEIEPAENPNPEEWREIDHTWRRHWHDEIYEGYSLVNTLNAGTSDYDYTRTSDIVLITSNFEEFSDTEVTWEMGSEAKQDYYASFICPLGNSGVIIPHNGHPDNSSYYWYAYYNPDSFEFGGYGEGNDINYSHIDYNEFSDLLYLYYNDNEHPASHYSNNVMVQIYFDRIQGLEQDCVTGIFDTNLSTFYGKFDETYKQKNMHLFASCDYYEDGIDNTVHPENANRNGAFENAISELLTWADNYYSGYLQYYSWNGQFYTKIYKKQVS